ncbi:MAG TPA: ribonuclease P protein component [Fluviicola sp.]|nr:ribonuclease P protein component [Fluviicola sp.]
MNERFGKNYKLCSQKAIEQVFKEGKSLRLYPFVVHFTEMELPENQPFQLVFSAPKRIFRMAHERNRIKRLLRETFRKKKLILEEWLSNDHKQLALFVIYTAKEELPLQKLAAKTEQLLVKITQELTHETHQK